MGRLNNVMPILQMWGAAQQQFDKYQEASKYEWYQLVRVTEGPFAGLVAAVVGADSSDGNLRLQVGPEAVVLVSPFHVEPMPIDAELISNTLADAFNNYALWNAAWVTINGDGITVDVRSRSTFRQTFPEYEVDAPRWSGDRRKWVKQVGIVRFATEAEEEPVISAPDKEEED